MCESLDALTSKVRQHNV